MDGFVRGFVREANGEGGTHTEKFRQVCVQVCDELRLGLESSLW